MPECVCGSFVSREYVRVFRPTGYDGEADVRACPACNLMRDQGEIRAARSGSGDYDVEVAMDG